MTDRLAALIFDHLKAEHDFFEDYWEHQWGHFPAILSNTQVDDLASLADLDLLVRVGGLRSTDVQVISNGRAYDVGQTQSLSGTADIDQLFSLFRQGWGFRIQHVQNHLSAVSEFCGDVEKQLGFPLRANAYISPANSQGLAPHFDLCDEFVIQLNGQKTWLFYKDYTHRIAFPTVEQRFSRERNCPIGEPIAITLSAGDLLYVPRGAMHAAFASHQGSIHLTFSALGRCWGDVLIKIIQKKMQSDVEFRCLAPFTPANAAEIDGARERLGVLLAQVLCGDDLNVIWSQGWDYMTQHKQLPAEGAFLDLWRQTP